MAQSKINRPLDGFPNSVPDADGTPLTPQPGLYAVLGPVPSGPVAPLFLWPDDEVAVFAGEASSSPAAERTVPVYGRGEGVLPAVPTGRVFVRCEEGERLEQHGAELARAGYDLERVSSFAPHAGWVRAASGSVADALAGLSRLQSLAGLVHVEVQWLRPRQTKS